MGHGNLRPRRLPFKEIAQFFLKQVKLKTPRVGRREATRPRVQTNRRLFTKAGTQAGRSQCCIVGNGAAPFSRAFGPSNAMPTHCNMGKPT